MKKSPKKAGKYNGYSPLTIARDMYYPDYILNAIRKCKTYDEAEKILIDCRRGHMERYKPK